MSEATDALEALSAAIDQLLAAPDAFDGDDELHAFVVRAQRERHRLAAALAPAVNRWDRLGVWTTDGSRSSAARLARDTNTSKSASARELSRAKKLQHMPATAAALAEGAISPEHVDLLGAACKPHRRELFERDEEVLVNSCKTLWWAETVRAVDYWADRADAEADDAGEKQHRDRSGDAYLYASKTLDGNVALNGLLDPIGGEIFTNELDRLEHLLYLADIGAGVERTPAQRRAAALVEMATRSASTPEKHRRPKPLFVVHVGDETARRLCELAGGTVLTPEELVRWADDAVLETFLFDGPSVVLTASQQRPFTGKLRRAIEARDRRCTHPSGCDTPATRGDIDHTVPWSEGGTTDQFNGRVQCTTHNRHSNKHDHGAKPLPRRPVDRLEAARARIRWALLRQYEREDAESEPPR